ncbi:alpha/beta fold hydrolase [Nocardioides daeguensis]|uniref:Alpha/beta hydrolase n=1 Tax=Nocardioides daeguensis TaxID=908359 RepID=A0ABP6W1I8_9ACTN|nr:alpha/beta hydrolase [Nocardioides daeguensis]MBV6727651.1 alpha/beta hydrolase [Nocardioides daeguensis]MCR1775123.1 alpha/beta hydrolase [Nocardioides daeguensis]
MSRRNRLVGSLAGALGVAAGTAAVGILRRERAISRRAGDDIPFGSLRSTPVTVVADDGLPLHVEVDEVEPAAAGGAVERLLRRTKGDPPPVTVVFVHGFCLNLDCWHFQRAAYRGLVRTVYYDQRSHGRSGHSDRAHANIDQLGRDLHRVLEEVVPDGPVVLVGHSMGGMSIVAFAEQFPELIGTRVVGVGLIATTAGGLDPSRMLLPMLPARLAGPLASRAMRTLHLGHRAVDSLRRAGSAVATVATDRFAFGGDVPRGYVEFVDEMLAATPFEVVADFFPHFAGLDKFDFVEVLGRVPTSVICGTDDRLTSIGHARKLQSRIPGSRLLECEDAGHMVTMERHELVNAELDQLITAASARAATR